MAFLSMQENRQASPVGVRMLKLYGIVTLARAEYWLGGLEIYPWPQRWLQINAVLAPST